MADKRRAAARSSHVLVTGRLRDETDCWMVIAAAVVARFVCVSGENSKARFEFEC